MSDINTDSEIEKLQLTKKSSAIIGSFPPINFDNAGSSCNKDNETEKSDLNTSNAHAKIKRKNQISSINDQSITNDLSLTRQSSLPQNRKNKSIKKINICNHISSF